MGHVPVEDALTGLPNRHSFLGSLRRLLQIANDQRGRLALMIVDIDRFALINAGHGYGFGDELLREVAQRLGQLLRPQDVAARIGDNRFAVLLPRVMNPGHVELAAEKLQRLMEPPFDIGDHRIKVALSCGVALSPEHATQPDHLFRLAERALAQGRQTGQRIRFAADSSNEWELSEHWDIEVELSGAQQRDELSLHYQPKLCAGNLRVCGAEALMRWHLPGRGFIPPDRFIPVAERGGQIKQLTLWALNVALRQANAWPHQTERLGIAVNVPAEMVAQDDLPDLIASSLELWGHEYVQLTVEITERSLLADPQRSFRVLSELRAMGVRIALDDFGTGYSCLAYFKDIPADELKIDRSFVRNLPHDAASADITALIIDLAHRFGMAVVAEGVEDLPALDMLRQLGCDEVQGYLFAKPMGNPEFHDWLKGWTPPDELSA
ncbi:putative bifunctional diguanylate cyclase/phosphodiesterase [Pseudomarimonas salicorniae]|uniref:Bifunctional diguanylate cyclase/phosphodiesterase n=1 Tax=Pseudomarimonas salicorniae TaxID=2933270 RepID=A0ABT0GJX9_9GAMM|nr:bifunctional diguanylate cyclase/phosphodiesterase [Lysobacter sp. CAU 1642]MCK7594342.1 bifunctional diguanylate cyclase/phosphodiesterase [Lysobacter sp. CAU 1642]